MALSLLFCFAGCKEPGSGGPGGDTSPSGGSSSGNSGSGTGSNSGSGSGGNESGKIIPYTFTGPKDETITLGTEEPISWANDDKFTIIVTEVFDNYEWYVNGNVINGTDGNSINLSARDFSKGVHTVTLKVFKNGIPYTKTIYFTVN